MTEKDLQIQELKAENQRIRHSNALLEKELKEYRDLEEQGLLLKLPCSVGTQVYIINRHLIGIAEADDVDCFCFKVYVDPDTYTLIALDNFGKGWFLTEQEAQSALEKMKGI